MQPLPIVILPAPSTELEQRASPGTSYFLQTLCISYITEDFSLKYVLKFLAENFLLVMASLLTKTSVISTAPAMWQLLMAAELLD